MTDPGTRLRAVTARSALLALGISILWGANIVAIKLGLLAIPPFWSAFWRMLISLPALGIWARLEGVPLWPRDDEWRGFLVLGVLCFCQISTLNTGTHLTSAAYASVLFNSHPVFTSLVSHYFTPGDRLSLARLTGLVVAFTGICLLFSASPRPGSRRNPCWGSDRNAVSLFCGRARRGHQTRNAGQRRDPARLLDADLFAAFFSGLRGVV